MVDEITRLGSSASLGNYPITQSNHISVAAATVGYRTHRQGRLSPPPTTSQLQDLVPKHIPPKKVSPFNILSKHLNLQRKNLIDAGIFTDEEYNHVFSENHLNKVIDIAKSILRPTLIRKRIIQTKIYHPMILPVPDGSFDINWSFDHKILVLNIPNDNNTPIEICGIDKNNSNNLLKQKHEDIDYLIEVAQSWIRKHFPRRQIVQI